MVKRIGIATLFLLPLLAQAQYTAGPTAPPVISDPSNLTATYEALMGHWFAAISPYAYDLFLALAGLEIAVFGWNLWMNYHGDIRTAMLATANKVLIIGFFLALLMNAGAWMGDVIDLFVTVGKNASGVPSLNPSMLLLQGFKIFGALLGQAMLSGLMTDFPTAIALILAAFIICVSFLVICFQFIVTKIQTFLALGMGVIFLGFGGSRWTTPYVERYFAFCVASGVKLMALYLLAGAAWPLTNAWITQARSAPFSPAAVEAAWLISCGAVLYAGICWYGSSQVSAMLGGSPNLTHSDFIAFMAPAVSAGVSAGLIAAGVATGGTTAVAGGAVGAAGAGGSGATAAGTSAASNPSGAAPPQPAPQGGSSPNGSHGSQGASAVGSLAQTAASAISRAPHGGHHASPPQFNGFHH
ncbi:MAG TPA: P-type conjugative transfer protein TrbL [Bryobacteraceae bacterium]|nr:P-type conjugative transfer protein TrbL [Bryobacteraceae bacterium]